MGHKIYYDELPSDKFDFCVICGEWSNGYAFCKDCYHNYDDDILLDLLNKITTAEQTQIYDTKCLICNTETNGNHFCRDCYNKYKNKELVLSILGCKTVKPLKEGYINNYRCTDGHWVKSKAEREIDNYLFTPNIPHIYEKPIPIGKNKEDIIHPDFCLPNYLGQGKDVYIEHWGYNDADYLQKEQFKLEQYTKLHLTVVCTYENEDSADIETTLNQKLNKRFIKEGKINGEQKSTHRSSKSKKRTYDDDGDIPF